MVRYTAWKPIRGKDLVARILRGEMGPPVAKLYSKRYGLLAMAFIARPRTIGQETIILSGTSGDGTRFAYPYPSDKYFGPTTKKRAKSLARSIFATEVSWYRNGTIRQEKL